MKWSRYTTVLPLLVTLFIAAHASGQQYKATIPYESIGANLPAIRIGLGGTASGTFVVDTGSSLDIISYSLARQLHLVLKPLTADDDKPATLAGKRCVGATITLNIGGIPVTVPVVVLPDAELAKLAGIKADGILGDPSMSQFAILFDGPARRVTFQYPGNLDTTGLKRIGMSGAERVPPFQAWRPGHVYVPIRLNNALECSIVLDTGTNRTVIAAADANSLHLEATEHDRTVYTIYGPLTMNFATLSSINIGCTTLSNLGVVFPDKDYPRYGPHVGYDALGQLVFVVDFPASRVYINPCRGIERAGPAECCL